MQRREEAWVIHEGAFFSFFLLFIAAGKSFLDEDIFRATRAMRLPSFFRFTGAKSKPRPNNTYKEQGHRRDTWLTGYDK